MTTLGAVVQKVRSKNAGPFWLTVDIFCGSNDVFAQVVTQLETAQVAQLFDVPETSLKRFDIPDLHVIKFSMPRPAIQGTQADRDMHGASFANLLAELRLGG